ncbi:GntR family transcriptional regulator [Tepidibacillus marianensis]|uniref:GntR family transcriptional regulator n=1 Tax=Tepidibacillus marianensis TaxID=3131995 RepID=UPI0030D4E734
MMEEFQGSKPIYLQLMERIQRQIIRRELQVGDKLPSVREMAIQSGVNPNTVQRTYAELEREGIVESRRGQGTFVTENKEALSQLRDQLKREEIKNFIQNMTEMGFDSEEIMVGLEECLKSEQKEREK